jgi:molecular chaperone GrpE
MSQVESDDAEENTVVNEFRRGYMLKDRVIRATLVGVARKPSSSETSNAENAGDRTFSSDE